MIIIYESFENLEESKKQVIINAGFKVFGENDYKKAPVEQIIKEAGISKGSLFYYFGSKKNFYLFLYEYCGERMKQLIDDPGEDGSPKYLKITDFFERLQAVQLLKSNYSEEYPHMFAFMKRTILETSPEVHEELQRINQQNLRDRTSDFFYNLDDFKFKDGIDPKMVMQLLTWCSEGCANQLLMKHRMSPDSEKTTFDFKEVLALYNTYVELLRNNFYKEEYLKG